MTIRTKALGECEIDPKQVIDFPDGMIGFETKVRFALLDSESPGFYWLQSLDEPSLAFVLIDPFIFRPDYTVDAPEDSLSRIAVSDPTDLLIFAVVTIPPGDAPMTANLQGPVLVNRKRRLGVQAISMNSHWQIRHNIVEEMRRTGRHAC